MKKDILKVLIKEAEEESKLDKTKKWVKDNSTKIGLGVGAAAGAGLGLAGAKKLNKTLTNLDKPYFEAYDKLRDIGNNLGREGQKLNKKTEGYMKDMIKKRKKDDLKNYAVLGGLGAGAGGLFGAAVGDELKNKEKEATIEKLAADYIDLKKNKHTGEFGTRKYNFKSDAKRYAPGLAGAGIGGLAANKLTKNKDNKMRNTLLGAAGGGTIGELARRMKKANVALKGENEAVITTFSPRRDDEMTEKLKRIIREYENDRG
jgi:hypothetical protein